MHRNLATLRSILSVLVLLVALTVGTVTAQTTQFTYQGQLNDNGAAANGAYDLQFKLFDALTGGAQQGSTVSADDVTLSNGAFKVTLDFGVNAFPGANRYLEIGVRLGASTGTYTVLTPRSALTSAPYAIRSLSAATADTANTASTAANAATAVNFNGTLAGDVTGTQGATLITNNAITTAKLANQSITSAKLAVPLTLSATLNNGILVSVSNTADIGIGLFAEGGEDHGVGLSGFGATGVFGVSSSAIGYGVYGENTTGGWAGYFNGPTKVLGTLYADTFIGSGSGLANLSAINITSGTLDNARLGTVPITKGGTGITTGPTTAGQYLRSSGAGSWAAAGIAASDLPAGNGNYVQNSTTSQATANFNISGNGTVGGTLAGNIVNATTQYNLNGVRLLSAAGVGNLFVGLSAGSTNSTGNNNAFFGSNAGQTNQNGGLNSFFGANAGKLNDSGNNNAFFGANAGANVTTGTQNVYVGSNAGSGDTVGQGNIALGYNAGSTGAAQGGFNNTLIGSGTNTAMAGLSYATAIGADALALNNNSIVLGRLGGLDTVQVPGPLHVTGSVGIGTNAPADKLHVNGEVRVANCVRNSAATQIAGTCSSDLRLKRDITPFPALLDKLVKLQPVNFYWRASEFPQRQFGATQSYGLIAQDVEAVFPDLVGVDEQGYKAVNYSKLPLLLLQAAKEQHQFGQRLNAENSALKERNAALETRLAALEEALQKLLEQNTASTANVTSANNKPATQQR